MKKKISACCFAIITCAILNVNAQNSDPTVLMTVGRYPVSLQEFKSMYYKNLPKDSIKNQKALDNYLKLFTEFRLKVNAAMDARLDTTPQFKQEMGEYRQKLADPYMRDQTVEDNLVKEAYERMKTDVRVSHILLKLSNDASPADTMAMYKKIMDIRNKIVKKEMTFEAAAKQYSMDDRSGPNGGDIGYVTSLETFYPFENAVYSTKVGDISLPVHTSLGYHLIMVTDKKADLGQLLVAHIMVRTPAKMSSADSLKLYNKIDSLYHLVKDGQDFAEVAKKFSQDPSSGKHGGTLPWFGVGRMPPQFEKASFELKNVGDISTPIRTAYGWHVIKLLGKKGLAPFDSLKDGLSSRIMKDERSQQSVDALVTEVKKKYNFHETPNAKEEFYKVIDSTYYTGKWTADKAKGLTGTMFTLGEKSVTQQDFANYLVHNQMTGEYKGREYPVNKFYPKFVKDQCLKFKNEMLEKENPAFAEMLNEYRDGILLFDITDKMVWTRALKDTTGLQKFYADHKNSYLWGERADASIYTCADEKVAKDVRHLIKDGKSDKDIIAEVNAKNPDGVSYTSGMYEKKDNATVDASWKQGESDNQTVKGKVVFVNVRKIMPPAPKNLDDVRGMVTTDYQNYLMSQWLDELRAKYPVTVNQQALSQVISQ